MTNYDRQIAKMIPFRMAFNGLSVGAAALWYLSRHGQINRLMKMKIDIDMILNVTVRGLAAGIVSDVVTRKLFVNYDKISRHKAAGNEVSKIMRTFPNARPYLAVHEKPNSYFLAMKTRKNF